MDDRNLSYCQSCLARQGGSAAALGFNWYVHGGANGFWLIARWKKYSKTSKRCEIPRLITACVVCLCNVIFFIRYVRCAIWFSDDKN